MRWTNRLANVTTTNSVLAGKELVARGVVTLERLQVIPNAIAVNSLRVRKEGESGELAKVETTWTWLAVGRLERQKAFDVALRAVDILTRSGRSLNLLIAGEGGEEHNLRDLCDQLGLGGIVDLLGYRNDVHDLLSSADAFLLSSRWEGLPNVVMEAMAAGVPVVATDVGGVRELIVDGVSGHIAPANDAAALAAAMARLMDATAEELNGFVESGHAHISEMFAPEAVFERWESLFVTLATES
jgi:glycosyltransferase involved in cell wall biosynthesis